MERIITLLSICTGIMPITAYSFKLKEQPFKKGWLFFQLNEVPAKMILVTDRHTPITFLSLHTNQHKTQERKSKRHLTY